MSSIIECIVCHKETPKLQSMQQASASGLSLFALFERILGFSLDPNLLFLNIVCGKCVDRFKEYDDAYQRAERAAGELIKLFGSKIINPCSYEFTIQVKQEDTSDVHFSVQLNSVDSAEPSSDIQPPVLVSDVSTKKPPEFSRTKSKPGRPPHLTCKNCNRKFQTVTSLTDHECHINAKPFICDICGQKYKTKSALVIHMIIHSGIRRHSCEVCGKNFAQRVALARHMPIHTGEMNYQVKYI